MIIVSQDEEKIVNFDNVNMILVREGKVISFDNTFKAGTDDGDLLAKYKTEERAKEVLIGIMQSYIDSENYKYVNGLMKTEELNRLQKGLVYEMPKE